MAAKYFAVGVFCLLSLSARSQYAPPAPGQTHLLSVEAGYDYSLVAVNLRYGFHFPRLRSAPFVELTQNTALPGLNNTRVQLGLRSWQGSAGRFILPWQIALQGVRAVNPAARFHGVGAVAELNPGLLFNRFGAGLNLSYNPLFATHITHSATFRRDVYTGVRDGWYRQSATNLRAGAYLLYLPDRHKSLELNLKAGYQTSGSLDDLLPPYYFLIGVNKRF
ncbi:hypothetical protein [Larkinella soli]|uniref:hypothetical protein n=1 Tax=Larkinella soli TaxID=1770527 RepID=UPI000FFBD22C|nr:hypothetical protein [Larkinella soli]